MPPRQLLRLVPWAHLEEWDYVFSCLYAADDTPQGVQSRLNGVKRVKAWRNRGKVPHAIDSTATLVEIWLRDGCGGTYGPPYISEHELRLMYTMTFVRFVNGFVDAHQKGMYAISVSTIAEQMGLPGWFVDLRHAGTHDQLPSLALLRAGCKQALSWLHANYWTANKHYMATTGAEIRTLLTQYKVLRKQEAKGAANDTSQSQSILAEVVALNTSETYNDFLVPVLLDDGYLVPTAIKKRTPSEGSVLPDTLFNLWRTALSSFEDAWPGFLEDLFNAIVENLGSDEGLGPADALGAEAANAGRRDEPTFRATLAAWAGHILSHDLLRRGSSVDWEPLLEACLRKPNASVRPLIEVFEKSVPTLNGKLKPFLDFIDRSTRFGQSESEPSKNTTPATDRIPELRDRLAVFKELSSNAHSNRSKSNKRPLKTTLAPAIPAAGWTHAIPEEWRKCPIGSLPGGAVPDLDLPEWFDDGVWLERKGILQIPCFPGPANGQQEEEPTSYEAETDAYDGMDIDHHPADEAFAHVEREEKDDTPEPTYRHTPAVSAGTVATHPVLLL
ncbi:Las1-like-domain-containing protein [Fimicolochytrium jonesii]|uniref:Las1-like-domain-containing protein n=1 Tax=Fimicolochytrium jonesii TaxID=1396493 RepID=UPI0022FE03CA|nr:Las1-like-domain-containing protein [Fimicolochytrium jonesii]KAI8827080.1 Las1-like-domain-containing protein [Fimicolochytrium jonesii]